MNWYPMTSSPMDSRTVMLRVDEQMIEASWVHTYGWIDGYGSLVKGATAWSPRMGM